MSADPVFLCASLKPSSCFFVLPENTVFFLCLSLGDAPYCTPEQYKECADPALGKEITQHACVNVCAYTVQCVYPTVWSP